MKKIAQLASIFALSIGLYSCSSETENPDDQPIEKKGKVQFYTDWKASASFDASIDGSIASTLAETTSTAPDCSSNSLEFSFTGTGVSKNYTATDGIFTYTGTVDVAEGCTAVKLNHPLVNTNWKISSYVIVDGTSTIDVYATLRDCDKDNCLIFPKDGSTARFLYNTVLCGDEVDDYDEWGAWVLDGNQLTIDGNVCTVTTLTETELEFNYYSAADGFTLYYGFTKL